MGFWESIGGQQFVKGTIPKLTDTLDRIADALEKYVSDGVVLAEPPTPKMPLDLGVYHTKQAHCPRCGVDMVTVQDSSPREGRIRVGCSSCLYQWYESDDVRMNKAWEGRPNHVEELVKSGSREDALEAALHMVLKDIWENECADGIKFEHLMMAREISNFDDHYPDVVVTDVWEDDRVQFARLICEIAATHELEYLGLMASTDLPQDRIRELFARAHKVFEDSKRTICPTPAQQSLLRTVSDALTSAVNTNEAQQMATELQCLFWENGPDTEHGADTLGEIANMLKRYGYGP